MVFGGISGDMYGGLVSHIIHTMERLSFAEGRYNGRV
jgi:hypothetical protein